MAKRNDSILDLLVVLPWYWSVAVSGITYLSLAYLIPSISTSNPVFQTIFSTAPNLATFFALVLLSPAPFSLLNSWRKRQQFEHSKNIDKIKQLDWQRFEELVAEYYRRLDYFVIENFDKGPDGGIDIRLRKDGRLHLVQCKHWQSRKVGVSIVREMYGVMISEMAATVIIVTSGSFTTDAKEFAFGKSIELINGQQLEKMIQGEQSSTADFDISIAKHVDLAQICPRCGDSLVKRLAKKGKNIGIKFYGCNSFPKCRYTQDNY